jgi:hypothetical protein
MTAKGRTSALVRTIRSFDRPVVVSISDIRIPSFVAGGFADFG